MLRAKDNTTINPMAWRMKSSPDPPGTGSSAGGFAKHSTRVRQAGDSMGGVGWGEGGRGLKRNKRFCLFRARDRPYRKSANNARKLYDVICDIAMVLSPKSAENHEMRHRKSERASRRTALIHAHKYGARASTQILVLPSTTDNMLLSHTGKNSRNSSKINNITHACATPSPPHTQNRGIFDTIMALARTKYLRCACVPFYLYFFDFDSQ